LKSKLHQAVVTQAELYYEGSLTVDLDLMDLAEMMVYEKVTVVNINNGERFETYLIPGERGSGIICLNGAAARKASVGDRIIILTYCHLNESEVDGFKPKVILLDEKNKVKKISNIIEPNKLYNV
jgi:aspartate 1-decarboxylase